MKRVLLNFALVLAAGQAVSAQSIVSLRPGLLNHSEGRIETTDALAGAAKVGTYHLRPGEELRTANGRAELLLAPCIFVRLAEATQIRMDRAAFADIELTVIRGSVIVEAVDFPKDQRVLIRLGGMEVDVRQAGIYRFDAASGEVRVFEGKTLATRGNAAAPVKKGKMLAAEATAPVEFDRKLVDRFQRWSARRSLAVARSNMVLARSTYGQGWKRAMRPWIWSMYLNAGAARASLASAPTAN